MTYRPSEIRVSLAGRHLWWGYHAEIISRDDCLPKSECPIHGWDGRHRPDGSVDPRGPANCICPVFGGLALQQGPWWRPTHRWAYRAALRAAGGKLYDLAPAL